MKTRHLFRTLLVAITALLMAATDSMAQGKPWAKLQDGVLTFSFGAKPAAATAVKCPECGKMVTVNQNFCPNCGTKKPVAGTIFEVPLNIKGFENAPWYDKHEEVKKVVFAPSFKKATNITSTRNWFYHMKNLTTIIGLENLNTTNVTDMSGMFGGCASLTSLNLSSFNTSKVTDMGGMFSGCKSLTSLNLSRFNTSKVTDMHVMFGDCKSLTSLNLSSFNTSKVKRMDDMFYGCESLTSLNLSRFNTSNVTGMSGMFGGCASLTSLNLSSFNTSKVTDMSYMFRGCKSLTSLNLSSFNTDNVGHISYIFGGCTSLRAIYLPANSWDIERIKRKGQESGYLHPAEDLYEKCPAQLIRK